MVKNILANYRFSKSLWLLFTNRIFHLVGVGLMGLFLPIFLFEKFNYQYLPVFLFFIVSFSLTTLVIPLGAMIMSKISLKKSMIIATFFLVMFYLCLYFYETYPYFSLIVIAIITSNIWRMLYWVPFHTDFVKFSSNKRRGQQYSILMIISDFLGILVPITAGLILNYFNYSTLFIIVMVIVFASIIPLFKLQKNNEKFDYSYIQTYKELFSKKNRKIFLAYFSDGAETIIGAIIWPIFIFIVLEGQYLAVGAVSALIIGMTVILDIIIGRWSDKFDKKHIIKYSSIFYAVGWIVKIFVGTASQIFIVSTYHNLTAIFRRIPFDVLMYEKAADQGHYVDEYTVLREISLCLGRVLMLSIVSILIFYFGIYIAFILAAIISLFINVIE
jgi:MFS family permease